MSFFLFLSFSPSFPSPSLSVSLKYPQAWPHHSLKGFHKLPHTAMAALVPNLWCPPMPRCWRQPSQSHASCAWHQEQQKPGHPLDSLGALCSQESLDLMLFWGVQFQVETGLWLNATWSGELELIHRPPHFPQSSCVCGGNPWAYADGCLSPVCLEPGGGWRGRGHAFPVLSWPLPSILLGREGLHEASSSLLCRLQAIPLLFFICIAPSRCARSAALV
ncbi:Hypothetical predicted protein [Podarcis lilfordi]|uniref:Uncharacterized protein n=1 Tax=Podarcis lilfordi TaxID=74358 RepID=A0AA35NUY1_9SAUR|nr:Hypothetical predicted protein [Podarcis lilfordi]